MVGEKFRMTNGGYAGRGGTSVGRGGGAGECCRRGGGVSCHKGVSVNRLIELGGKKMDNVGGGGTKGALERGPPRVRGP